MSFLGVLLAKSKVDKSCTMSLLTLAFTPTDLLDYSEDLTFNWTFSRHSTISWMWSKIEH